MDFVRTHSRRSKTCLAHEKLSPRYLHVCVSQMQDNFDLNREEKSRQKKFYRIKDSKELWCAISRLTIAISD